ncbi:MAG: guanine deaminase [Saprospiraceae bacterium]|nr:tRNA-specific adenosine deaminase [Saprospirales bacterium]RME00887.1 MAG: nucleoside deaminase [Bacteroidota bacterium]
MEENHTESHAYFMREAIRLAREGMRSKEGGPFGAVVVKDGKIIGRGNNRVASTNDPTAHAEVVAIREACKNLGSFQLDGCIIYTSCEPCPMCLGAIYWARPEKFFYACTREDAAAIDFDDEFIYKELSLPLTERKIPAKPLLRNEALPVFEEWRVMEDKVVY